MRIDRSRFANLIGESVLFKPALFVGCGSVGSNVVRAAASCGIQDITLADGDVVGQENIAVSWLEGIEDAKVSILADQLIRVYGCAVHPIERMVTSTDVSMLIEEHEIEMVVVSTDNIESRNEIWRGCVGRDILYVDFRIGRYSGACYSFRPSNEGAADMYVSTLKNKGTGLECGVKAYPGLTVGWCPMVMVDIIARESYGISTLFSRIANMDVNGTGQDFYAAEV